MATLKRYEILHLSLLDGVGPATVIRLEQAAQRGFFAGDKSIYGARESDFMHLGFSQLIATKLVQGLGSTVLLEQELSRIERHDILWATLFESAYPELLKHIHLPPPVLYWQGNLAAQQALTLAIVGSRSANWYGKQAIDLFVPPLVKQGAVIVSGGALGADSMAHAATLYAGGKTIAVLGSGLLDPYPVSNKPLFLQIIENGGAVLSPFPLTMHASAHSFPARNRVIAGMSSGCIVVQAAAKSGALITAQFALEQGRDVFAVPGPIEDPVSAGCHALIQQGAKLVTCAEDIMGEYGGVLAPIPGARREQEAQASLFEEATVLAVGRSKKLFAEKELSSRSSASSRVDLDSNEVLKNEYLNAGDLPTPQSQILHYCAHPQSLDELAALTGLSFTRLHELLFELQIQGALEQNMVGMWQRIH